MSRATGVVCDVCNKFIPDVEEGQVPEDWFVVRRGMNEADNTDVCSTACLCKVGKQLAQIETMVPEAERLACELCGKSYKNKQGLGLHKTRTHGNEGDE